MAGTAGEESRHVLDQNPSSGPNKLIGDSGELEEEGGSVAGEASPFACDGEILAGETAEGEINSGSLFPVGLWSALARSRSANDSCTVPSGISVRAGSYICHVLEAGDSRPVSLEHSPSVGVGLALGDDADACSLGSAVDAADA